MIKRIYFQFIAKGLLKIALQQSGEASTMTSLVLSHLMNGVVDSVEASYLRVLGDTELILASTSLCGSTLLQIRLGVPNALTQQLSKLGSMLSLLETPSGLPSPIL